MIVFWQPTNIVTECYPFTSTHTWRNYKKKVREGGNFFPPTTFLAFLTETPEHSHPSILLGYQENSSKHVHTCCSISNFHSAMYTTWTSFWLHTTSANISFSQPTLIKWAKNINSNSVLVLFCHNPISSRCPRTSCQLPTHQLIHRSLLQLGSSWYPWQHVHEASR